MRWRVLGAAVLGAALAGCFSPVGTARTLAPGSTQFHLGVGAAALLDACGEDEDWCMLPPIPVPDFALGFRAGLLDGVEGGLALQPAGLGADVKLAPIRRERLAVALAPSVIPTFSPAGLVLALPVMVDLDLARNVTLVAVATPVPEVLAAGEEAPPLLGLGVGLGLRASRWFAVQPGVQYLVPLEGEEWSLLAAGVGLVFGPAAAREGEGPGSP